MPIVIGWSFPFDSCNVWPERESWVFRFNPGQRLPLFDWSSKYMGER